MKERPILFSGPMVRAILEGRKTQTRRIIKNQEWYNMKGEYAERLRGVDHCPYGKPGDWLWVRETFFCVTGEPGPVVCNYRADFTGDEFKGLWKPSIHMPRWASRITLEITDVRVERLQDITVADARAEGISIYECPDWHATIDFKCLWESINGPDSWSANPWVWVVNFEVVK